MKVQSIQHNFVYNKYTPTKSSVKVEQKQSQNYNKQPLVGFYLYNISFGKIKNSEQMRALFAYGIPDLYSEIDTIDPKRVAKLIKTDAFEVPVQKFLEIFKPFEQSLFKDENEIKVYEIIKEQARISPEKDVKTIIQDVSPLHLKRLRKKQAPILKEIEELGQNLPDSHRYKFKLFMADTYDKLAYKPIAQKFSTKDFQYKLEKIQEYISKRGIPKEDKVMAKLIKESKKLPPSASKNAVQKQKQQIEFMDIILKKSVLRENEQLKELINTSKSRLNGEKLIIQFSRKNFIYDLSKLLNDVPDKNLQDKMIDKAQELPTSRNCLAAFIVKIKNESSEKIAYRLLDPSMASVEHLLPASCGGEDKMSNFACASRRTNTDRGNVDFTVQLKRIPKTREYAQRQMNKYIELANNGIFYKHKVDINYIEEFKNAIKKQSKGQLVLDTSNLNPPPPPPKPIYPKKNVS